MLLTIVSQSFVECKYLLKALSLAPLLTSWTLCLLCVLVFKKRDSRIVGRTIMKLILQLFEEKMSKPNMTKNEWFHCVPHQVSISEADLQAMGGTITMVTQEGTTITIPAHELATQGAHSVTMVTADGSDEQVRHYQSLVETVQRCC